MKIEAITTDFFDSNIYLFESNGQKIMIDCGGTATNISALLSSLDFCPDYVLLTHGHIDHILALSVFAGTDTKIFIHRDDAHFLRDPAYNLSSQLIGRQFVFEDNVFDYESLPKELEIQVLHTPGHTPGSVCLMIGEYLFSGDTLFCGGIGNTAFPGGDYPTEIASIKKLLMLPADTCVYPGHGCATTVANEQNTI